MNEHARGELSGCLRRAAMAIAVSGVVAAATVHADPGEAMFLHDTLDGKTLLYARLATFDVTAEPAVLDLPRRKDPQLKTVQGLTLQCPDVPVAQDFQVVDTVISYELNHVFDVKQVRAERLPAVESIHQLMIIPAN